MFYIVSMELISKSTHYPTNKKLRLESIKLQSGYEPHVVNHFTFLFSSSLSATKNIIPNIIPSSQLFKANAKPTPNTSPTAIGLLFILLVQVCLCTHQS